MKSDSLTKAPLRGIIPPLVTPLVDGDSLDVAGLERLIEHVLAGGVSGLFILGTSGEAPCLSYRLRRELIDRTCRQVRLRVPVLVGVTDTSLTEAVSLSLHAAAAGAQAVVSSAPYYFPPSPYELLTFFEKLASTSPLPVFAYNMPGLTKVRFEPETVRRLLDLENVAGIKDSSGDMGYFHQLRLLIQQREDWTLLIGPEELLAESVLLGGHGGINGGANVYPRLYVDLYEAALHGELEHVRRLHHRVMHFSQIYRLGRGSSAVIRGLKCALACLGICDDVLSDPFEPISAEEQVQIEKLVREMDAEGSETAVMGRDLFSDASQKRQRRNASAKRR